MDAGATGDAAVAVLRIKAQASAASRLADAISKLPACSFAGLTAGRFDMIALIGAASREILAERIDQQVSSLEGIEFLEVREPMKYVKHRFDLVHIP